ncbi:hypothetical protein C8J56DRAFT_1037613 [Mycena floridula]|nr:hypothetical protein C8J56DRAFT_1037613 [Mycena floridula]
MFSTTFTTFVFALLTVVNAAPSAVAIGPAAVNLRTAGNSAILAKTGVSTVTPSVINGAVAVSPIAASALKKSSLLFNLIYL